MRLIIIALMLLTLVLAGCNTAGPGLTATQTVNQAPSPSPSPGQTATQMPNPDTLPTSVTPTSQASSSRPENGSLFAIDEVGIGPDGYVALTNFTDQPASLGGLFLCQGTQCFALPDVAVAPNVTVRVAAGNGMGLDGVVATGATIGELRPADGEVALYASQNVKDPKAMLVYLEWGSTPHASTQVAIDAGLWIKGSYAPSVKNATRLFRQDTGLWLFDTK